MATFSTPTDDFVVWSDAHETGIFTYLRPGPRGRNVFKLINGTYSENQPSDANDVAKTYYGGHIYELSTEEEAELVTAGYGQFITA
jgi:hypothetical protein